MGYKSIFTKKEKPNVGGYKSIFGQKEEEEEIVDGIEQKQTMPDFLGGGSYTSVFGQPEKLVKTPAEYGLVPTKKGEEAHHIFPVSLGGLSEAYNFKALGKENHARITKVGNKALKDLKNGIIDLPEARLKVMTKYQEILDEKKGIKQGMKANLWAGVKQVFSDIGKAIKKDYEKKKMTPEERKKEYATRALAGYEGRLEKEKEVEKIQKGISKTTYKDLATLTQKTEKRIETLAKTTTIPARFVVGDLITAITSYSLERANSDFAYDPRSDTEKLLIGENKIRRITEQEDIYGTIARSVGVPAALTAMVIIENPFLKSTGVGTIIKKAIKNKATRKAGEQIIKLGANELYKIADDAIKMQLKTGKITKKEAGKAIGEIVKMKKPKTIIPTKPAVIKPTTKAIPDELAVEARKYKSVEEFMDKSKNISYHATNKDFTQFSKDAEKTLGRKLGDGTYFSNDLSSSKALASQMGKNGKILYSDISSKKLFNLSEDIYRTDINNKIVFNVPKDVLDIAKKYNIKSSKEFAVMASENTKLRNKIIKDAGYDGIKSSEKDILIFDASDIIIKTKSQLTEIFNKAEGLKAIPDELAVKAEKFANINKIIKEKTQQIINKYNIKNYIDDIYLVGSRAKGIARETSDYDFVVKVKNLQKIATKNGKFDKKLAMKLAKMEDEIDVVFKDFKFLGKKTDIYITSDIEGKAIKLSDIATKAVKEVGGEVAGKIPGKIKKQPIKYVPVEKTVDKRKKIITESLIGEPSIPKRIENQAIEKGLVDNFKNIEGYDKISFKDQAKKVGEIIDEDPHKAIRIALGEELPTNGALPESVFIAVKNQAIKKGDTDLLIQLATAEKGVAREATILGQRIKMLDEGVRGDDTFKSINRLVKNRKEKFEIKGKKVSQAKKTEVDKIKKNIKKVDKYDWDVFIKSIEC